MQPEAAFTSFLWHIYYHPPLLGFVLRSRSTAFPHKEKKYSLSCTFRLWFCRNSKFNRLLPLCILQLTTHPLLSSAESLMLCEALPKSWLQRKKTNKQKQHINYNFNLDHSSEMVNSAWVPKLSLWSDHPAQREEWLSVQLTSHAQASCGSAVLAYSLLHPSALLGQLFAGPYEEQDPLGTGCASKPGLFLELFAEQLHKTALPVQLRGRVGTAMKIRGSWSQHYCFDHLWSYTLRTALSCLTLAYEMTKCFRPQVNNSQLNTL